MALLIPIHTANGRNHHAASDNDELDAAMTDAESHAGLHESSAISPTPTLIHRIRDQTSILTLLTSGSKIFAGTQGGDLLVCHTNPPL